VQASGVVLGDEDASTILAAGSVDELMTRLEQQPYMDTAVEEQSHALPHFQGWSQRNAPFPSVARTALTEAEKKQVRPCFRAFALAVQFAVQVLSTAFRWNRFLQDTHISRGKSVGVRIESGTARHDMPP
jgi:hypothetical protein